MNRHARGGLALPPPIAEIVLAGLVADGALRDAMLGDLAEEFANICQLEGSRNATLWYWRQTVGAVPSLLRASWASGLIVVVASAVVAYVAAGGLIVVTNGFLSRALLGMLLVPESRSFCVAFATLSLIGGACWAAALSYARHRLAGGGHRAPVADAVTQCVAWAVVAGVWIIAGLGSSPLWYRVALHVVSAAAAGLCALRFARPEPSPASRFSSDSTAGSPELES